MTREEILQQILSKGMRPAPGVQIALSKKGEEITVPDEIQIMPLGKWEVRDMEFTGKEAKEIINNFNALSYEPVVDCEHMSLWRGDYSSCGWVKELTNKGADGLWATIEWTDYGREQLLTKNKRYVSPVIFFNAQDHRTADNIGAKLISVALTATPFLEELDAVVNSSQFSNKNNEDNMEFLTQLRKALGMDEKSDQAAVLTKVTELLKPQTDPDMDAVLQALRVQYGLGDDAAAKDIVQAMSQPQQNVSTPGTEGEQNSELEALKKENAKLQQDKFIASGMTAGKIVDGNKEKWEKLYAMNQQLAEVQLDMAPVVVPNSSISGNLNNNGGGAPVLDDNQKALNKQLGLTAEDIKTYGKKDAE